MSDDADPAADPAPAKRKRGRPFTPGKSGNPAGRPAKAARVDEASIVDLVSRLDGWANLLTGQGVESRDKRLGHKYYGADVVSVDVARELWRGDPEVAKLIERAPEDETREGFDVDVPGDEEASVKITDEWKRLDVVGKVRKCLEYRRAYGGGALLLGVDDGVTDLRFPLRDDKARGLSWVLEIEARELTPLYYYADVRAPKFGEVAIWRYSPLSIGSAVPGERATCETMDVHESRLVRFDGVRVSRSDAYGALPGWGDSLLTRVWSTIRDFAAAFGATGLLVEDFGQAVYKIKGLAQILATDNSGRFAARLQATSLAKSTLGMLLIDAEHEDYLRTTTPVTGLPELLELHMRRVAAAADTPVTLFWGVSPGGMNATGESDIRGYYDRRKSTQEREIVPALERVSALIARGLGIEVTEDRRVTVKPRPLWQESATERATARKTQADADAIYLDRGVLSPDEVRESRFAGGEFSYDTQIATDAPSVEVEVETDAGDDLRGSPPVDVAAPASGGATVPAASAGGAAPSVPMPGASSPTPALEPAKTAFTGVQVTALIDVVRAAGAKEISRESAAAILELAFPVDQATAMRILGPETFEPPKPEPPVINVGGAGGPPKAPGAGAPPPFAAKKEPPPEAP